MTRPDDLAHEMNGHDTALQDLDALPADEDTTERLLRGVPVDDAPASLQAVADVLTVLRTRTSTPDLSCEREGVAAFLAGLAEDAAAPSAPIAIAPRRHTRVRRLQFAAAAAVASLTLLSGVAAVGALPGAAQDVARDMLDKVGISVPGPSTSADGRPDTRGRSTEAPAGNAATRGSGATGEASTAGGKSATAGSSPNGVATSDAASDGKSQAGEHGSNAGSAPVQTPSAGGTGTADVASDGKSSTGTDNADSHSDGRSSAGSSNSAAGKQNKP